ncbi:MAG: biotin--[acetyl-CoA-carboxylase] ligase [Alistipes sp.]|jgi:BirA family biotin operon repressor/biotin-[acetyl-CoA-carboxylase] ligase|nr:biotin--[acetyl-CoA-carboxylase] ligase [Alistipes sp.]
MFYYFEELTSTIDEARDEKYRHGDVVVADHQTAGRGQRGKRWSSAPGENLTFSVVLDTSRLRTGQQFAVLQTVALALVDLLGGYGLDARVKWPNDIYVGDRKIVGVLIDHSLGADGMLARSGAGVGINVRQRVFDDRLPNPTSMALETGRTFDLREVLERFHGGLMARFGALGEDGARESLRREYHGRLYRLDVEARFALPDGTPFTGTIRGVEPTGELLMETPDGPRRFLFHELSFVI